MGKTGKERYNQPMGWESQVPNGCMRSQLTHSSDEVKETWRMRRGLVRKNDILTNHQISNYGVAWKRKPLRWGFVDLLVDCQ